MPSSSFASVVTKSEMILTKSSIEIILLKTPNFRELSAFNLISFGVIFSLSVKGKSVSWVTASEKILKGGLLSFIPITSKSSIHLKLPIDGIANILFIDSTVI